MRFLLKLVFCLLLPTAVFSQTPVVGKDYVTIGVKPSHPTKKPVTVTEFFSYGCPSCYRLDKSLIAWVSAQGNAIHFKRVPVIFHPGWDVYAKAYHTIYPLKLENTVSPALFQAIQVDKKSLDKADAMIAFLEAHGVASAIAKSALTNSTTINVQLIKDAALMRKYDIKLVPTVVIDGYYKTDLSMAQNEAHFFEILQALVKKSSQGS